MKKKVAAIFLVLCMVFALAACGGSDSNGEQSTTSTSPTSGSSPGASGGPTYGGIMKQVTSAEGSGPIGVPWSVQALDIFLTFPIMETLFRQLPNAQILPHLAETWSVNDEGTEILIQLRQGVKFHDGSDFNAEIAQWNLTMAQTAGAGTMAAYNSVEVRGEYEIAILIDQYTNSTLSNFTGVMYTMISRESYEANGEEWAEQNPVGTGPFKFVEYNRGAYVIYERFDDYWQEGKPYLDGLEIHLLSDIMTQNIALKSTGPDGIDALGSMNGEQIKEFDDLGYTLLYTNPISLTLMPSHTNPDSPLANILVRQALSHAIDRQSLCDARGFGVWQPAIQYTAPGRGGYVNDPTFGVNGEYNPERARELLAEAGYPDGFTTVLYGEPGMTDRDAGVAIQAMLADVGITASVEFPEAGGYTEIRTSGWPDAILYQRVLNMTHMETCVYLLFGTQVNFFPGVPQSEYLDGLLASARNVIGDNYEELKRVAEYMLEENYYVIPMYYNYEVQILKPRIQGYNDEWGLLLYPDLWISE